MAIYRTKTIKVAPLIATLVLSWLGILYLFFRYKEFSLLLASTGLLLMAFFLGTIMVRLEISTNTNTIKKRMVGKTQEICWDWIYNICTWRGSDRSYATVISFVKDPEKVNDSWWGLGWMFEKDPQNGTMVLSEDINNYPLLLKEIRENATQAQVDEMTEKIIREGIPPVSAARKTFWISAVVFFLLILFVLFFFPFMINRN